MKANEVSEDNEGHVAVLENAARQNDGCCSFCSNEGNEDNEDNAARQNDGVPRFRKMK